MKDISQHFKHRGVTGFENYRIPLLSTVHIDFYGILAKRVSYNIYTTKCKTTHPSFSPKTFNMRMNYTFLVCVFHAGMYK